jgi:hypothetical protein
MKNGPTGAGDAFRAGFLAGAGHRLGHEGAARLGCVMAALVTETSGTQEYLLQPEEFLTRISGSYRSGVPAEMARGSGWHSRHEQKRRYESRPVRRAGGRPVQAADLPVLSMPDTCKPSRLSAPHGGYAPGQAAIWLFVACAALGFSIVVRASGAHRSASTLPPASGYQLFNLSPIAVVPAVSLIVWWIPLEPVAYALGGLSASSGYLLAVASLFHAIRRAPR